MSEKESEYNRLIIRLLSDNKILKSKIKDLKQEINQTIKERILKCKECSWTGNLLLCEEHKFWLEKFNLTEKDLIQ